MSTLFGHLAPKFGSKPEDLATEALGYILERSEVALQAFVEHVNQCSGAALELPMHFSTQERTEDGGIPDLWGRGSSNTHRLLVEVKFWAGLTSRQPNGYLEPLHDAEEGVLLFLVPEKRREHVWRAVVQALQTEDVLSKDKQRPSSPVETAAGSIVCITSWSAVLDVLKEALVDAGERQALADVRQLGGLCARLDAEAFHPLRAEELSPNIARRIWELKELVRSLRDAIQGGVVEGWSITGSMSSSMLNYVFSASLDGVESEVGLRYFWWKTRELSPLWVRVFLDNQRQHNTVASKLRPDVEVFKEGGRNPHGVLIPLMIPLGVDRERVQEELQRQLVDIADRTAPVLDKT